MTRRYLFCGFLVVALLSAAVGCTDAAAKLPDYGSVPEFTMTDSSGHAFDSKALASQVWIADFIYTQCPAECPRMTAQMHKLEQQVRGEKGIKLVSISVDPQHDTPAALDAFARRFGGPNDQWVFLTGSPAVVHEVAYNTFHVGDVIGKIEHSTKFVLVDKHGDIRGYYSSFDPEDTSRLLNDAQTLRRARS